MEFQKVNYSELNHRQKENYNFHKIASVLANYGYNCIRLTDDYKGADFIAIKEENAYMVQQKGRFTVSEKYKNEDLFICFIEDQKVRIYRHKDAVENLTDNILNSKSWVDTGEYSWGKTPERYSKIIRTLPDPL